MISFQEAEDVKSLDLNKCDIFDMTGIGSFVNLETLSCGDNEFTSLGEGDLGG
jgi:Leucine-rich repeat (LRR) protein